MKVKLKEISTLFLVLLLTQQITFSCLAQDATVHVIGAMRDAMRKGEIAGKISLDSLKSKDQLYGIGPLGYFKGEILVNDGVAYSSKVANDSTMNIYEGFAIDAPFFVYAHVAQWFTYSIPDGIRTLSQLEEFLMDFTLERDTPFVFKLKGKIDRADIHVQNLPTGTVVRSPKVAHTGQVSYELSDELVDVIGFYSKQHHGIFTHHDTNLHAHLITTDRTKMGHIDDLIFKEKPLLQLSFQIDKP